MTAHRDALAAAILNNSPVNTHPWDAEARADAVIEHYRNPANLMALIREVGGPVAEVLASGANVWSGEWFRTHLPDDRATLLALQWVEAT